MQIVTWFLVLSLFFPRASIFLAWLFGGIPAHTGMPFALCFIMSVFCARILCTIFVGMNLGMNSGWFIAHLFFCIVGTIYEWSKVSTESKST